MDNLYSVIIQRSGKPRKCIGVHKTQAQAYALAGELAANMVENKGYRFDGKLAHGAIIRLILNGQRGFIAVVQLETAEKS